MYALHMETNMAEIPFFCGGGGGGGEGIHMTFPIPYWHWVIAHVIRLLTDLETFEKPCIRKVLVLTVI